MFARSGEAKRNSFSKVGEVAVAYVVNLRTLGASILSVTGPRDDPRARPMLAVGLALCGSAVVIPTAAPRPVLKCRAPQPLASHVEADASLGSSADAAVDSAIEVLVPAFAAIDRQTEAGLRRLLDVFRRHGVGAHHFAGVDGYGHGDLGREALDSIYAELLGAEAALVRVQCFSGTHAIACALYGVLRPGQELLGVSGAPYDTLEEVIGLRGRTEDGLRGTLADFGVSYRQVELTPEGTFDLAAIGAAVHGATRVMHVQRSCGYAWRPSIPVAEIGRLSTWLKAEHPVQL